MQLISGDCRLIPAATADFLSPLSLLLGVTHSSDYHMWQRNEFASNGVREFAEKGEAWTLMKEVETAGERIQSVYGILSAPAVMGGTGQMAAEFEVFARHSYVSLSTPGFLQSGSSQSISEASFLKGQYVQQGGVRTRSEGLRVP